MQTYTAAHDRVVARLKATPTPPPAIGDYLSISEHGLIESCLAAKESEDALVSWFLGAYSFGVDYGPGTEHAGTEKLQRHLADVRKGNGGGPIDPPHDPVQTGTRPLTYDWPTAVAYAEDGYHYDGTQGVSAEELVLRKETLSYGLPTTWSDFEPSVPRALFLSNTVTSLLGGTDAAYRLDDGNGTPMTGPQFLEEQRAVRGGGRGPSGDAGATEAGPGVVS